MNEHQVTLEELLDVMEESLAAGGSVCFAPRGISMLPMLRQGKDSVTLRRPQGPLKKYDIPLYRRDNGQFVLHRVIRAGDTYTCIGDNQFVYEQGVRPDRIIGVVIAFTHGGKEYSTTDWSYRLYCILWHYSRWPRRLWRALKRRLLSKR